MRPLRLRPRAPPEEPSPAVEEALEAAIEAEDDVLPPLPLEEPEDDFLLDDEPRLQGEEDVGEEDVGEEDGSEGEEDVDDIPDPNDPWDPRHDSNDGRYEKERILDK